MPTPSEITEKFIKTWWPEFEDFYRSSAPFTLRDGEGTPSRLIRSEHDCVLQVAIRIAHDLGREWVHMETTIPQGRLLDLVVTNPEPLLEQRHLNPIKAYDFAAEFKIISNLGRHPNYNPGAAQEDVNKLYELKRQGVIKEGIVCLIVKVDVTEEQFSSMERSYPGIRVLRIRDGG